MKLGLVIYSTDPETVWNVFRFGVFALKQGDRVKVPLGSWACVVLMGLSDLSYGRRHK